MVEEDSKKGVGAAASAGREMALVARVNAVKEVNAAFWRSILGMEFLLLGVFSVIDLVLK